MGLPPAFLDELRFRVPLTQVVGRKVKLTRAGHEWKGCCPFHNEKTPSFYINEDKGFYHCFGCAAHGDVIRFLTEHEGLSFIEAVKQLADLAGLDVPEEKPEERARAARAQSLYEVMAHAAGWFTDQLNGLSGAPARAYLANRGLSREIISHFNLGFAPDHRTGLQDNLRAMGVSNDQLVEAGLVIAVEGKPSYDRFRGRLMFPIRDARGRVIAFGGRILGEGQPKYLNSPDTPLFDKGRTLFNLDLAGPPARKAGNVCVVEGYMDVIALAQAGIETAVAPLGTALTEEQLGLLWRLAPEPTLCFDGDSAGQRAATRAAYRALPLLEPGKSLRFVTLPVDQDPDSLVRSQGPAAFTQLAEQAMPLIERLWQSEVAGQDLSTPERRALLSQRVGEISRAITNSTVRRLYDTELRARFDRAYGRSYGTRGRQRSPTGGPMLMPSAALQQNSQSLERNQSEAWVRLLLITAIRHPGLLDQGFHILAHLPAEDPETIAIRDALVDEIAHYHANQDQNLALGLDSAFLQTTLRKRGLSTTLERWIQQDRLRLPFSAITAKLEDAERGFVLGGSWQIRLQVIAADMAKMTAELEAGALSDDEWQALHDQRASLLRERTQILEEMGRHARDMDAAQEDR